MSDEDSACFYMNFTEFITLSAPVTKTTEFTKKKKKKIQKAFTKKSVDPDEVAHY